MNDEHFPHLLRELRWLLDAGLNESVEILAQLYLSSSSAAMTKPHSRPIGKSKDDHLLHTLDAYEIIADSLHKRKETKRALNYYRLVGQQRKFVQSSTRTNTDTAYPPLESTIVRNVEIDLMFKESTCLRELKDLSGALAVLDNVPTKHRDLQFFLLSATLYLETNVKNHAIIAYKEALARAPIAVEIAKTLIRLGVEDKTIITIITDALKEREDRNEIVHLLSSNENWYFQFISALYYTRSCQVHKSVPAVQDLLSIFPKNPLLLTMAVEVFSLNEMTEQSDAYYHQLRRTDASIVDGSDRLGMILWERRNETELSRLASDVISTNPQRPEGYNIAAMYSLLKDEVQQALAFVEKACLLKPTHANNYLTRGLIHIDKGNHTQALIAFAQANGISTDLLSFQGMIEASTGLGKLKDAAKSAREMVEVFPKSADACFYLGKVLAKAKGPDGVNASINAFMKTLRIHPRHRQAATALAVTFLEQGKAQEAVDCLVQVMLRVTDKNLRLLLAKGYSALGQNDLALEQLQLCGDVNVVQTDSEVLQEIDRIESVLKAANAAEVEYEEEDFHAHLEEDYSGSYQEAHESSALHDESEDNFRARGRMFSDDE